MFTNKKRLKMLSILMPLLFCIFFEASAAEKKMIILLDPAHGGKDKGLTLNSDVSEKDITLAVALAIQKELSAESKTQVVLTRDKDQTLDLEDRREVIEKIKPDFLMSLHVNGGFGKEAAGFEIYYPAYNEEATTDKKAAKSEKYNLQNKCQSESLKMAKIVQENMNNLFPRKGRGLRTADLPVADGLQIPALSVELGFTTNAEDKKKLLAAKTQMEIAKALAKSIKTFSR
ncbi:MAG TPA: N-acetylmuramoyl-L-alanine amidase [Smithella sp.]|nr:N-acetylmuramoyl-L-alanine amidase [Smithella sp.]HNY50736.1 N-acetylmuramoyl-L-alanine amidase [Smithella sp.]HOG90376.1 N-acetylmuramoyl-L-alanine amidase [Smithella sp.]HOU49997.1 N-acetylmuramoyl-L-alanine amidase [Smithella sp.]HQG65001.1 N-acetylmuramoyl-L-alanine amidase [Smithella sp.]